jgi:hypothetical protein
VASTEGGPASRSGRPADDPASNEALRAAAAILERASVDEALADEARDRYRIEPMRPLAPEPAIARHLCPDEHVLAVRRSAGFDRRQPLPKGRGSGLVGDLYLTSKRLVLVGRVILAFDLPAIAEASLEGERLLLVMADGTGLAIDVDHPRLLRVELATARAGCRV